MKRVVCVIKTAEHARWIVPQLEAVRERGHEVHVVLPSGGGRLRRMLAASAIGVTEVPWDFSFRPGRPLVTGLLALRRALRRQRPDVVFYHLYASALAARIASLGLRVRRVHMVAGPLYLDSRLIRVFERFATRLDDVVIAGSRHTQERYQAFRRKPTLAIPYGVDTTAFRPSSDAGASSDVFRAVMVAYVYAPKRAVHRGVGIKGHELLIDAWTRFAHEVDGPVTLSLLGSGATSASDDYRDLLVRRTAAEPSIVWLDSRDDVRSVYESGDLSVAPSLSENHGSALESSAMGLPAIVSDAGALPEVVDDGVNGWVVPAGEVDPLHDALHRAHAAWQDGRLGDMGVAARRKVLDEFDLRSCCDRVAAVVVGDGPDV